MCGRSASPCRSDCGGIPTPTLTDTMIVPPPRRPPRSPARGTGWSDDAVIHVRGCAALDMELHRAGFSSGTCAASPAKRPARISCPNSTNRSCLARARDDCLSGRGAVDGYGKSATPFRAKQSSGAGSGRRLVHRRSNRLTAGARSRIVQSPPPRCDARLERLRRPQRVGNGIRYAGAESPVRVDPPSARRQGVLGVRELDRPAPAQAVLLGPV
jgi:hypothetical protein